MLALEWRLTLLTLVILPAFIIPAKRMGPKLQRLTREGMQLNASMNNTIAERFNVAGALVVKLFGKHDRERDGFADRAGRVRDIGVETAMYSRILFAALGLVAAVGTAVVYLVGGNLAISGAIGVGTIAAMFVYVGQIYQPLTQLTNARVDVLTALVSFERVFEVLDFPPLVTDRPGAIDLVAPAGRSSSTTCGSAIRRPRCRRSPSLEEQTGATDLDDESAWILRDVSFTVAPGELVALVGPSGAGKTTTALLVPRIYDVSAGEVRVDGHDVRDYTLESLRGMRRHGDAGPAPLPRHRARQPAVRAARRHRRRAGRGVPAPASTTSSRASPTATTPSSASAATACRAARSSGWPSPACCSRTRRS